MHKVKSKQRTQFLTNHMTVGCLTKDNIGNGPGSCLYQKKKKGKSATAECYCWKKLDSSQDVGDEAHVIRKAVLIMSISAANQ